MPMVGIRRQDITQNEAAQRVAMYRAEIMLSVNGIAAATYGARSLIAKLMTIIVAVSASKRSTEA